MSGSCIDLPTCGKAVHSLVSSEPREFIFQTFISFFLTKGFELFADCFFYKWCVVDGVLDWIVLCMGRIPPYSSIYLLLIPAKTPQMPPRRDTDNSEAMQQLMAAQAQLMTMMTQFIAATNNNKNNNNNQPPPPPLQWKDLQDFSGLDLISSPLLLNP